MRAERQPVRPTKNEEHRRGTREIDEVGDKEDEAVMEEEEAEEEKLVGGEEEETTEECKPKIRTSPNQPTSREVEEHMITHVPYRSWCPYCVTGKSKADAHFKEAT